MHEEAWATFLILFFGLAFAIFFKRRSFTLNISSVVKFRYGYLHLSLWLISFNLLGQQPLSQSDTERLFKSGITLVEHSNFGAARVVFNEFLEKAPSNDSRRPEAEYYRAFSALNLNHTDGEKLVSDFITNNPSSPRASTAYFDIANFFYDDKNYTKAIRYYKKVDFPALTSEQQGQGHFNWGYSLFTQKQLDEALAQFNFVKKLNNAYSPAASYYAGFIAYNNGQFDEALTDLKRAEASPSYATVVPYLIANVYYGQHRYDELIAYSNTLSTRKDITNQKEISMLVADAYYFKKDYNKAVEAYEQYLADNPEKAESSLLYRAGYANYALNQDAKAIDYLRRSASSPDSTSYYASYYLGVLYLKRGDKLYASNAFDYARKYPKDQKLVEESSFQFAKVSYDLGKPDIAIAAFEQFLKDFPSSSHQVEVKEWLAQAYINGNNFHKAIEYIESLPKRNLAIDQAYQKATYLQGTEAFNMGQYAESVKNFEKSLEYPVDKNFAGLAAFWSAEAYSIGERYEEAINAYLQVIGLGSAVDKDIQLKARYGIGYAYYNTKMYEKALVNFREFVQGSTRTTPNYVDGLIRLADCYYVRKSYDEAIRYFSMARNIGSSDNDYVLLQTGVIAGIQRKYSEARTNLTSLIQSYPKSPYRDEALFQRAQFEIEQGNYQVAIDGLSQLIREGRNSPYIPYAYMRRAASYYNLNQYDKTVSDYATVVKQYSNHPVAKDAILPLQEALNAAGRSSEFDSYLVGIRNANPQSKELESLEFESGKNMYFNQQYQSAVTNLSGFITNYPESSLKSEAQYYLAESYYRLNNFEKALSLYRELATLNSFSFVSKAVGRVAEIDFRQGRYEEAIPNFHRLERMANGKKDLYNAWAGLMESFYFLARYDSVDVYANNILEKASVNANAQNKATLFLGKSAMARGDYETAKDEFLNTLNTAHDEYGAEAKYHLGEIQYLTKQYKQCTETLIGLNNDFSAYDEWVGKAFLLMADNFVAMGEIFQAKGTLKSLIDNFPSEKVKDQARAKLKEIEASEKSKQQPADSIENNNR